MLDIIKRAALKGVNAGGPVELMEAVVIQAPPGLLIRLKSDSKLLIPKDIIIVAEHLTRHDRVVTIEHAEMAERDLGDKTENDYLDTDDKAPPYTTYKHSYVKLTFEDVLKEGDEVLVISLQGGQFYYIADRVIRYE